MPIPWLVVLRVTPMLSSTALLVADIYQVHSFHSWLHPGIPAKLSPGKVLPYWLQSMVNECIVELGITFTVSVFSGAANLYVRTEGVAWRWYAVSLGFTLAHLIFSREALHHLGVGRRVDGEEEQSLNALKLWLRMNRARFTTSDLPAFVTAFVAATLSLNAS